jgi:hypothetical protein
MERCVPRAALAERVDSLHLAWHLNRISAEVQRLLVVAK